MDENTNLFIPCLSQAFKRLIVPIKLLWAYLAGSVIDSPAAFQAAKWIMPSNSTDNTESKSEFECVLKEKAQQKMDKALKREINLAQQEALT